MLSDDSLLEFQAREVALDQFRKLGQNVVCLVASSPSLLPEVRWNLWQRDQLDEYNMLVCGIANHPAEYDDYNGLC